MSFIKASLRSANASASNVSRVSISEIAAELQITGARLVNHNASGNTYLHLIDASGDYLSVKVGKKVNPSDVGNMKALIDNYVIYTGEGDNGRWFTFGPVGEFVASTIVSAADLFGTKLVEKVA